MKHPVQKILFATIFFGLLLLAKGCGIIPPPGKLLTIILNHYDI